MPNLLDHRNGPCDPAASCDVCNPAPTCAGYACSMPVEAEGDRCTACPPCVRCEEETVEDYGETCSSCETEQAEKLSPAALAGTCPAGTCPEPTTGGLCDGCEAEVASRVALDPPASIWDGLA